MTPRVYVTQDENKFDLAGLDQFGRRITVFSRSTYPDEVDQRIQFLVNRAEKVFRPDEYNPYVDYVALIGDPLGIAVVFMVLGSRGIDTVRVLKFDRKEGAYYEATIELKRKKG